MIIAHLDREAFESHEVTANNQALLKEAVWVDLLSPSKAEEDQVELCFGLDIPTSEEMAEIELSSRLYKKGGVLFMTATIISQSDTFTPRLDPVSFVLTAQQLITVRYVDPKTFSFFSAQLKNMPSSQRNAPALLVELLDANINRLADILEIIGQHLDEYSKAIFIRQTEEAKRPDYLLYMQQIGYTGDFTTKARESALTFLRLIPFLQQTAGTRLEVEESSRLTTLLKDVSALSEHAHFLANRVTFLLDATLGMVNIEQNNIIKIFSVAAVIFLPPTLIASLYGMNFHSMPELSWKYGYLFAVILMLLAAWLPYKYFRHRKWL